MAIQDQIQASGLHYKEIASAVGCDPATAWRWTRGGAPSLRYVFALSRVLGCKPEEISPEYPRAQ